MSEKTNHVLLVEDNYLVALDLACIIEDSGCMVVGPAPTVARALSILKQAEPNVAFLDENLNGASVAPVAQELARRGIPFIVHSGYGQSISSDPLLREARRIQKPASPRQIHEALADLLSAAQR